MSTMVCRKFAREGACDPESCDYTHSWACPGFANDGACDMPPGKCKYTHTVSPSGLLDSWEDNEVIQVEGSSDEESETEEQSVHFVRDLNDDETKQMALGEDVIVKQEQDDEDFIRF